MINFFIKSTIECEKELDLIPYNRNVFNLIKERIITATEGAIYLKLCGIVRWEKEPFLTPEIVKKYVKESIHRIKKILIKLHKVNLLFYIKNKNNEKGYVITEYQETNEDIKKFLEQKHPDWSLIEKEVK